MSNIIPFDFNIEEFKFNDNLPNKLPKEIPSLYQFPAVYIIFSEDKALAYIGETTNIVKRVKDHLKNSEKNHLNDIKIICSPFFNKSSVLHIENNLIQFMGSDEKFELVNKVEGLSHHHYYQQSIYQKTFEKIWEDLQLKKLVNKDLLEIKNSDLFKYSPFKVLSDNQMDVILNYFKNILNNEGSTTFIEGSAGTGKTILAVYLIKLLITDHKEIDTEENSDLLELVKIAEEVKIKLRTKPDFKIALVVPMSPLRSTLKKVFKSIYGLKANMVIGPSDVKKDHYDLLIVDEAHRLSQRKNISYMGAFGDTNIQLGFDKEKGTQLDWILEKSDSQIFFYDEKQSIKPSDIPKENFDQIRINSKIIKLTTQMRSEGGENYINFVDQLLDCQESLLKWEESSLYDFKLFESFKDMIKELKDHEITFGLCRTISGYSWKWLSKNSNDPDVTIEGIELRWNKKDNMNDWINSTNKLTEMGCIHTTQGYDLNYSGIIFGNDITYNEETKRIETKKENYYDRNGKAGISSDQLHDYIINIYKTIMYRGIKGTYIYCYDKKLENYFKKYIPLY